MGEEYGEFISCESGGHTFNQTSEFRKPLISLPDPLNQRSKSLY